MARVTLRADVRGAREIARAFRRLPEEAQREAETAKRSLSRRLAQIARAAGRADTRQSARAASTVRPDFAAGNPAVVAGPHKLLFGSEFGIKRRVGWYARPRYLNSKPRQFRPHRGSASYWFFRSIGEAQPEIDRAWSQLCDRIVQAWDGD